VALKLLQYAPIRATRSRAECCSINILADPDFQVNYSVRVSSQEPEDGA